MPSIPAIWKISRNAVDLTIDQRNQLVSFTYQDEGSGASAQLTMEWEGSFADTCAIGDAWLIEWHWAATPGTRINSGTLKCSAIRKGINPETTIMSAIAFDYGLGVANISGYSYTNATFLDVVATHANAASPPLTYSAGLPTWIVGNSQGISDPKVITSSSRLQMLREMAETYGFFFTMKSGEIRMTSIQSTYALAPSFTLYGYDCSDYNLDLDFTRCAVQIVAWHSGTTHTLTTTGFPPSVNATIDLRREGWYSSVGAATARCWGQWESSNGARANLRVRSMGDTRFRVGITVTASFFVLTVGTDDYSERTYLIKKVTHSVSAAGWVCDLELSPSPG